MWRTSANSLGSLSVKGSTPTASRVPKRHDRRIIIHFDYDCFYAAVFEAENPALKRLPFAVQQKHIIVTCNYEARRRGLRKLQLIKEARQVCPEVIIELGEDLTRFRNASKELYGFLKASIWSGRAERLGFDEVFLDVTDMIDYNVELLNSSALKTSFFHLDRGDPTVGFAYDAREFCDHIFPAKVSSTAEQDDPTVRGNEDVLALRLKLGSHLALYLRQQLAEQKGYTATVGISTNKLLSKLIGNVHKPTDQTTLIPPYLPDSEGRSSIQNFLDDHDVGNIPGIGFKMAHKIRNRVLAREARFDAGLLYGGTLEDVKVRDVRTHPSMSPESLEALLSGPGSPKGIGGKIWGLLHGVDDTEVGKAREVPRQISIEDSYIKLNTMDDVLKELRMLSRSLLCRMRLDLTEAEDDDDVVTCLDDERQEMSTINAENHHQHPKSVPRRWLAHPKVLRLTTRPRPPLRPDGTRSRSFTRISRSGTMPTFVFSLTETLEHLAERLVDEALVPIFHKLHPEKHGWDLSLMNIGATHMEETAADKSTGKGRDIGRMFRTQEDVLKAWKVEDRGVAPEDFRLSAAQNVTIDEAEQPRDYYGHKDNGAVDRDDTEDDYHEKDNGKLARITNDDNAEQQIPQPIQGFIEHASDVGLDTEVDEGWDSEEGASKGGELCRICGAVMPSFAMAAHERFHTQSN
ncbi:hypothetical protein MMC25_006965 [Agyrium rufum]|nr:hypothetical protein [Agyrium rufum]